MRPPAWSIFSVKNQILWSENCHEMGSTLLAAQNRATPLIETEDEGMRDCLSPLLAAACTVALAFVPGTFVVWTTPMVFASQTDKPEPPKEWKVTLTATGGEMGKAVDKIEIVVKDGRATGTRLQTPEKGEETKKVVTLPAAAVKSLWTTLQELNAWELPDFNKPMLDSPDYTIGLAWGGKSRAIQVKGFSQSDPHKKLILSVH